MTVKHVQNHLDFALWPQNPSKIHHWQRAWVLRWFPSRWYTSDLGFYVTQWDQPRTSLCQKLEQKHRRAKMYGHQITHWDGVTWCKLARIPFKSLTKTCTIFKHPPSYYPHQNSESTVQSTHHDQFEASKYQWRFKTYQGRISSRKLNHEIRDWKTRL